MVMKHFAFLFLGVALLAACRKDDIIICDLPITTPSTFADLRAAAPAVQKFTFNLAQAQSFRTRDGATAAFGANAFILPNGNVATGQAELRLREIYSVPDMILADMPTTAQSRDLLISGGEFNIQVWQGSTRLRMAARSVVTSTPVLFSLTSPVPATGLDNTQMALWVRSASSSTGNLQDSTNWRLFTTPNPASPIGVDLTYINATAGYYPVSFPLDSISNWNIDQFWRAYQNTASGPIGIEAPNSSTATTTRVYFRPVGYNGLARCYLSASSLTRWSSLMPYGADVIAVVLQERNGQLYYGTQRLTTQAGAVVTPTLQALSAADIIQRIRQL
jgi:hypothetical protein